MGKIRVKPGLKALSMGQRIAKADSVYKLNMRLWREEAYAPVRRFKDLAYSVAHRQLTKAQFRKYLLDEVDDVEWVDSVVMQMESLW